MIQLKNICKTYKSCKMNDIEKSFIKLIKKYKYDWDGLSSIFDVSSKGVVRNINVFDIDHIEYIRNNI